MKVGIVKKPCKEASYIVIVETSQILWVPRKMTATIKVIYRNQVHTFGLQELTVSKICLYSLKFRSSLWHLNTKVRLYNMPNQHLIWQNYEMPQ